MDQLTVHTPGLNVFVLTLRLFKLGCLMTSKTSGNDRLYTAQVPNLVPVLYCRMKRRPGRTEGSVRDKEVGWPSAWWLGRILMVFSVQTHWTARQLRQQHRYGSVTLHVNSENKVEKVITDDSFLHVYFPNRSTNSSITIFLQSQRICSSLLSALCSH